MILRVKTLKLQRSPWRFRSSNVLLFTTFPAESSNSSSFSGLHFSDSFSFLILFQRASASAIYKKRGEVRSYILSSTNIRFYSIQSPTQSWIPSVLMFYSFPWKNLHVTGVKAKIIKQRRKEKTSNKPWLCWQNAPCSGFPGIAYYASDATPEITSHHL